MYVYILCWLQLARIKFCSQENRVFLCLLFSSSSITIPFPLPLLFLLILKISLPYTTGVSIWDKVLKNIKETRHFHVNVLHQTEQFEGRAEIITDLKGKRRSAGDVNVILLRCWVIKTRYFLNIFIKPYPTAFPYGNGMVLHFYQQQESSTTKTVHKVINKGLKAYV